MNLETIVDRHLCGWQSRVIMDWVSATLLSAVLLGSCELLMKHAVRDNTVVPVLIAMTLCSAGVWAAVLAWQTVAPAAVPELLRVERLDFGQHVAIAVKSCLVGASWICSYFAVKHLPVTIASPVRATSPIWTLVGALVVLHERPTSLQLLGVIVTAGGVLGLSWVGRLEGLYFPRNRWIGLLVASTLLGAASVLYDKHLFTTGGFGPSTVQAWFYFYLSVIFAGVGAVWWWGAGKREAFRWRWSIPLISATLLLGDFIYFQALRDPDALIVLVAAIRRSSTLVAFFGAWWIFRELNGWRKLPAVGLMLTGIVLSVTG